MWWITRPRTVFCVTLAVGFICGVVVAHPEDAKPSTVDMTAMLKDFDGNPLKDLFQQSTEDPNCAKCDDLSLGQAVVHALLTVLREDNGIESSLRWAWGDAAGRVRKDNAAKLSGAEQKLFGDRILKVYANIPNGGQVMAAALPLVDPNREIPKIK
jgi:hypothetical protein